jgi:hypothetical protein
MNNTIITIIQNLLKFGGTVLVTKGIASDSQVADIAGGVIALVGVVWEFFHHKALLATTPPATTPAK